MDTSSTILTGSSDGFIRAVQMFPTKLLGVIADHGEWPVERINIGSGVGGEDIQLGEGSNDKNGKESGGRVGEGSDDGHDIDEGKSRGQGRLWVGSAGHDEVLRMTDLNAFFVPQDKEAEDGEEQEEYLGGEGASSHGLEDVGKSKSEVEEDSDEDNHSDVPKAKKRRRKQDKDPLVVKRKKGRNEMETDGAFFDGI
jgi:hypothetical protein